MSRVGHLQLRLLAVAGSGRLAASGLDTIQLGDALASTRITQLQPVDGALTRQAGIGVSRSGFTINFLANKTETSTRDLEDGRPCCIKVMMAEAGGAGGVSRESLDCLLFGGLLFGGNERGIE